jgi:hypothetical protein
MTQGSILDKSSGLNMLDMIGAFFFKMRVSTNVKDAIIKVTLLDIVRMIAPASSIS